MQIAYAYHLDTKNDEVWWNCSQQLMLAVMEVNLAHFSTSLPLLGPFRDKAIQRFRRIQCKVSTSTGNGNALSQTFPTHSHCSSQADTLAGHTGATSDVKNNKMQILVQTTTYTVISRRSESDLENSSLAVQVSGDAHGCSPGLCLIGSFARASTSRTTWPEGQV